jgi:hypothetical protein
MWEPQLLATLRAYTACRRLTLPFLFYFLTSWTVDYDETEKNMHISKRYTKRCVTEIRPPNAEINLVLSSRGQIIAIAYSLRNISRVSNTFTNGRDYECTYISRSNLEAFWMVQSLSRFPDIASAFKKSCAHSLSGKICAEWLHMQRIFASWHNKDCGSSALLLWIFHCGLGRFGTTLLLVIIRLHCRIWLLYGLTVVHILKTSSSLLWTQRNETLIILHTLLVFFTNFRIIEVSIELYDFHTKFCIHWITLVSLIFLIHIDSELKIQENTSIYL